MSYRGGARIEAYMPLSESEFEKLRRAVDQVSRQALAIDRMVKAAERYSRRPQALEAMRQAANRAAESRYETANAVIDQLQQSVQRMADLHIHARVADWVWQVGDLPTFSVDTSAFEAIENSIADVLQAHSRLLKSLGPEEASLLDEEYSSLGQQPADGLAQEWARLAKEAAEGARDSATRLMDLLFRYRLVLAILLHLHIVTYALGASEITTDPNALAMMEQLERVGTLIVLLAQLSTKD